MELIQSMAESILEKVESLIEKKDSGTKVFEARVVEISSSAKVKIKIDGTIHTAKSNIYCEVDDLVRVVAPNNNWKKLYIEANLTSGKTLKDLYESKAQQLTFEDYTSTTYSEDIDTSLAKIVSNGVLGKLFEGIKGSLINLNTRLTSCNNDLKNCLPLTGGTLTGQILYLNGGTSRWLSNGSSIQLEQIDTAGSTDNRTVLLINSNKTDLANSIKMFRVTDGRISSYKLYGDHNPHRRTLIGQSSDTNISEKPWFKVASLSVSEAHSDSHIVFFVRNTYDTDFSGILVCRIRTNSAGAYEKYNFYWLCSNASLAKSNFILAYKPNVTPCLAEIWCKVPVAWQGVQFDVISEGTRTDFGQKWSLTASGLTNGGYAEITSGYTQIVSV